MFVTASGSKSPDRHVYGQNTPKNNHARNDNGGTVHGSGGSRSSARDHHPEINGQNNSRTDANDSSVHFSPTPSHHPTNNNKTDEQVTITNETNVSIMTDDDDGVWRSVDGTKNNISQRYHKYLDVTLEDAKLDMSMQFSDDGSTNHNNISSSGSPLRVIISPSPQVEIYTPTYP